MPKYKANNTIDNIAGKVVKQNDVLDLKEEAAAPLVANGALTALAAPKKDVEPPADPPADAPKDPPAK